MPDYWRDWLDINRHAESSSLRKNWHDRGIRKLRKKLERRGIDPVKLSQADIVGNMFERERREGESEVDYKARCKKMADEFNRTMYRFVSARLLRGDFSDYTGWQYRSWFEVNTRSHPQRWTGEKVNSLAVLDEQGIGDEIMFGSCIPDLQKLGIEVTVECDPRLLEAFERSLGCKVRPRSDVVDRATARYVSDQRPEDAIIPAGELMKMFRRKKEDFPGPYLKPDPKMVEKWSHLKGKTGLAWRGRRGKFDPKDFGIEGAVCLQYDAWEIETEGMVVPECDLRNDIEDVLGICANLEKVLTVPQTVVHLSGAQGVPVEVVIPPVRSAAREETEDQLNWRYGLGGRSMPFYPSVTVYPNLYVYKADCRERRRRAA